jgi:hypothetical protein
MFATLRRASVALGVAKYERDACEVMARMGKLKDYEEEMLNLMVPARYEFEHGESSGSCVATPSVRTATSAVVSNSPPSPSPPPLPPPPAASVAKTRVAISGAASPQWMINGVVTAKGSAAEGLLLNARLIQGIFDDDNEVTRVNWAYPDTQVWDATRNTDELIGNLSSYVANGMRALTVGLQGGRWRCGRGGERGGGKGGGVEKEWRGLEGGFYHTPLLPYLAYFVFPMTYIAVPATLFYYLSFIFFSILSSLFNTITSDTVLLLFTVFTTFICVFAFDAI